MITVYGAEWCEDTRRSRRHLRRLAVAHIYHDVDYDAAALARAMELNEGKRRTPTIDLDGEVLVEPSNEFLTNALIRHAEIADAEARERLQVQNVGDAERAVRAGVGLAVLVAATRGRRSRWPLILAGGAALFTGVTGWCPCYAAAGVSSLDGPGDRPDEAQRTAWLAPAGG